MEQQSMYACCCLLIHKQNAVSVHITAQRPRAEQLLACMKSSGQVGICLTCTPLPPAVQSLLGSCGSHAPPQKVYKSPAPTSPVICTRSISRSPQPNVLNRHNADQSSEYKTMLPNLLMHILMLRILDMANWHAEVFWSQSQGAGDHGVMEARV